METENTIYHIYRINGPVVFVRGARTLAMQEMVYVGESRLIGEVIGVSSDYVTIQMYEDMSEIKPGAVVIGSGQPMSVTLGPGILKNIFDGIQRPLLTISGRHGAFIPRGANAAPVDEERLWDVTILPHAGDVLEPLSVYAETPESETILHRCMLPPRKGGRVVFAAPDGQYRVNDVVLRLDVGGGRIEELTLCQQWPIRRPRPVSRRLPLDRPLITGQRIIDTIFPVAKGGTAAVPGGFGTGKTMMQHQLAKWSDADIIVYIGCGERGNEMTQVLEEFGELADPRTGKLLTDRTILIANTSNMPVAAREASIYTGITLAEYYRDMGYHVAMMADSTSRWAEALREISGRLEEMPAEEGFPAYLPSRLAEFYERSGYCRTLNGREGSITIIGAVSPQGGDFSEPVTQNTKRLVRTFWALDKSLAYSRHYAAVNWNTSYSEYALDLEGWYAQHVNPRFTDGRRELIALLHEENQLMEIVKLIGSDVLADEQKLVLETAKVIRVGFLQQNAFHPEDTYVGLDKQYLMMDSILYLNSRAKRLVEKGVPMSKITATGLFDKLIKMKYDIPNDKPELFSALHKEIDDAVSGLESSHSLLFAADKERGKD